MESFLIDEYRSRQDLSAWVLKDGVEYVAYRLWDDEFYGEYDTEEIEKELARILS
jgi:TPP-dependent pyruvate/acetoin dehydrogenase alpha subunit